MGKELIRVWNEADIEEIEAHLLIVGDLHGDCAHCKELGLDYISVKECPQCKTPFKYVSVRTASAAEGRFTDVKRVLQKRADLMCVDYHDFKRISGRNKAKKFLG